MSKAQRTMAWPRFGQNAYEEVNFQPAASRGGQNYGWNVMKGMRRYRGAGCDRTRLTAPVAEYANGSGNCSTTGGYVYRGAQYPSLQGVYFYGDFHSGQLWGLRRSASGWENARLLDSGLSLSSFGEDESGNLYLVDYGNGDLHRLALPCEPRRDQTDVPVVSPNCDWTVSSATTNRMPPATMPWTRMNRCRKKCAMWRARWRRPWSSCVPAGYRRCNRRCRVHEAK